MPPQKVTLGEFLQRPPEPPTEARLSQRPFRETNPKLSTLEDFLLAAIGLRDPLAVGASPATGAGALFGMAAPLGMAMRTASTARKALKTAGTLGELIEGPKPITAWHGSPHDFDKFSLEKIGTGEGAQAYGHGLYFAEKPSTAAYYKDALSRQAADPRDGVNTIAHNWLSVPGGPRPMEWQDAMSLMEDVDTLRPFSDRKDIAEKIAQFVNGHRELGGEVSDEGWNAMRFLDRQLPTPPKGKMYEVGINAHPDDFLDWDKPLSQQSEKVRKAVGKLVERDIDKKTGWQKLTGDEALRAIVERAGKKGEGEAALKAAGIKGVRYLDQGSRGQLTPARHVLEMKAPDGRVVSTFTFQSQAEADKAIPGIQRQLKGRVSDPLTPHVTFQPANTGVEGGTSNYVVFDDSIIDIRKKMALLLGLGGAAEGARQVLPQRKQQ